MTKRKYATDEEAKAGWARANKAHWADPVKGEEWRAIVRVNVAKARAARTRLLSEEMVREMLAVFVERDPSGERVFRHRSRIIAKRYGISLNYLHWLASRRGVNRRKVFCELATAEGRAA